MKVLFFLFVVGYAVNCDDNNYYVVEMSDKEPRYEETRREFRVYWNVPTMQCHSKRIPFDNLYQKYGILQNKDDRFRGEVISILYDPGLFPALLKNESSGKFKFRNGGVPQEGDTEKHLALFRTVLEQSIPDEDFKGIGIIDFESWRPIFRQNFGVLVPYKDVSYELEKKLHWWWPTPWIQAQARKRFEEAARSFMELTLTVAKEMRPNAVWGYYGFPYCFNMANNNFRESCADKVSEENDRLHWLWSESSALYPSVYSSRDLTSSQLASLIRGRVHEAERVNKKATVLPYFWFRYRDDGYFSEVDLKTALSTVYKSNASGLIIWGSSNDVNTIAKCAKLLDYLENTLGPAVAEYTKPTIKVRDKLPTTTFDYDEITRKQEQNMKPQLDPEFHWIPPENYTKDIEQNVEEEIKKKPGYNLTDNKHSNETTLTDLNNSVVIEWLLNNLKDNNKTHTNQSNNDKQGPVLKNFTTADYINNDLEASQSKDSVTYDVSHNYDNLDVRINTTNIDRIERSESYTTANINEAVIVDNEPDSESRTTDIYTSTVEAQSQSTNIEPYLNTEDISVDQLFFNQNTFADITDSQSTDFTTEVNTETKLTDIETSTTIYRLFPSMSNERVISRRTEGKENREEVNTSIEPASTALDQIRSNSHVVASHKPYICIIFYIYSVVKCLCEVFGKCT